MGVNCPDVEDTKTTILQDSKYIECLEYIVGSIIENYVDLKYDLSNLTDNLAMNGYSVDAVRNLYQIYISGKDNTNTLDIDIGVKISDLSNSEYISSEIKRLLDNTSIAKYIAPNIFTVDTVSDSMVIAIMNKVVEIKKYFVVSKNGAPELVDDVVVNEEVCQSGKIEVGSDHLFRPDENTTIRIRKIISYKFSDFVRKFKTKEDLVTDTLSYLEEYITIGVNFEKLSIIVNFLNEYMSIKDNSKKDSRAKSCLKSSKKILKSLEEIKVIYIVRSDDYTHTKCPHERSGHWRRYKSGKKIWINNIQIHKSMIAS